MKARTLTDEYSSILRKYKNGADVDDADIAKLDMLASIGLIKKGISIRRQQITAKTTPTGIGLTGNWLSRLIR